MNSDMVKPEKFGHLHLVYHFTVPLMDKVTKNKRSLELVTSRSSVFKTSSEKILYLLYIIWPSLMMSCKVVFELFQKLHLQIYASQFMISEITPLSFVLLNLESVERKGKKLQKFEYLENVKGFLDEIKNIFHSF